MSNALHKQADPIMPPPPVPKQLAVLHTRCGCSQVIEVPDPPPMTVTVELAPVKGDEKAVRVFRATGRNMALAKDKTALVYVEDRNPEKSLIVVPGIAPPKDLKA